MSIYLIGAPVSGKSTVARQLKAKFGNVNILSFEAMRNGFIKAMPDLQMDNRESRARREILPIFIVEFAQWNEKMTGDLSIVEGTFCTVEQLQKLVRQEDVIICLGYGGKTLEEIVDFALARIAKDEKHYFHGHSRADFLQHFYDIAISDQENLEYCKQNQIAYFDVTKGEVEKRVFASVEQRN